MIARLCSQAPTRREAVDAMAQALDESRMEGINHNLAFLPAIMHNRRFRSGSLTTAFIAEEFPDGFHGRPLDDADKRRFAAAAVAARLTRGLRASGISGTLNGAYHLASEYVVSLDGGDFAVTQANLAAGNLSLLIDGKPYDALVEWHSGAPLMRLANGEGEFAIQIARLSGGYRLGQGGRS